MTTCYQLLSALPYLPPLFKVVEIPVTPLLLEQRLKMLEPEAQQVLQRVRKLMQPRDLKTDEIVIPRVMKQVETLPSVLLRRVFTDIFIFKRIIIAMGARDRGSSAPLRHYAGKDAETDEVIATPFETLEQQIAENWDQPYFRFENNIPELVRYHAAIQNGEIFAAKQQRIGYIDRLVREAAEKAGFSLDGVMLYVMTWMLLVEWLENDGDAALNTITTQAQNLTERALARIDL